MSGISGQSEYSRNQFFERTGSEWTSEVEYTYDVAERLVRTQRTSRGRRWVGDEAVPPKRNTHRALDDIKESIAELQHYRKHYLKV